MRDWAGDRAWRLLAPTDDKEAVGRVAQALRDERKRCAGIAVAQISVPGLSDNPAYVHYEPADNMARKIATAIRGTP